MNADRRGPLRGHAVAAAVAAALALACVGSLAGAASAQAPTDEQMARLRERVGRGSAVRLRTPEGAWVERRVTLGPEGVGLPGAPAYGASDVAPRQPGLVPWSRVSGLDLKRGGGDRGLLYGAFLGGVAAAALTMRLQDEQDLGGGPALGLYLVAGAAGGAVIGAALGGAGDPWVAAWPERR